MLAMDDLARSKRTLAIIEALSDSLNTGLTKNELAILVALVENGCNPEVSTHLQGCWTLFYSSDLKRI